MRLLVIICGILFSHAFVNAQNKDSERIMKQRINRIQLFHLGVSAEYASNFNSVYGARGYIGIGSSRHLFNADLGFGIRFWNVFSKSRSGESQLLLYYADQIDGKDCCCSCY